MSGKWTMNDISAFSLLVWCMSLKSNLWKVSHYRSYIIERSSHIISSQESGNHKLGGISSNCLLHPRNHLKTVLICRCLTFAIGRPITVLCRRHGDSWGSDRELKGEDGSPIGNGNLWVPSRISEVWKSINLDSHIGFKLQRTWFYLVLWGFEWIYSQWNRDPLPIGGETNILPKLVGEYWWTTLIQILIDQRTGGP